MQMPMDAWWNDPRLLANLTAGQPMPDDLRQRALAQQPAALEEITYEVQHIVNLLAWGVLDMALADRLRTALDLHEEADLRFRMDESNRETIAAKYGVHLTREEYEMYREEALGRAGLEPDPDETPPVVVREYQATLAMPDTRTPHERGTARRLVRRVQAAAAAHRRAKHGDSPPR